MRRLRPQGPGAPPLSVPPVRKARFPSPYARGLVHGYRSGLEERVGAQIHKAGVKVRYEEIKLTYVQPVKTRTYTPDFPLENGIIIETKGEFDSDDRQKHKLIRQQYPDLDIRFVFSNSRSKIGKKSETSYGLWCKRLGIPYADKDIPQEWFDEPPCEKRLRALHEATKRK
jgi:hypothetical protein